MEGRFGWGRPTSSGFGVGRLEDGVAFVGGGVRLLEEGDFGLETSFGSLGGFCCGRFIPLMFG